MNIPDFHFKWFKTVTRIDTKPSDVLLRDLCELSEINVSVHDELEGEIRYDPSVNKSSGEMMESINEKLNETANEFLEFIKGKTMLKSGGEYRERVQSIDSESTESSDESELLDIAECISIMEDSTESESDLKDILEPFEIYDDEISSNAVDVDEVQRFTPKDDEELRDYLAFKMRMHQRALDEYSHQLETLNRKFASRK